MDGGQHWESALVALPALQQPEHLDEIKLGTNEYCFHAGTKLIDDKFYAIGGRVLNFVSLSENFSTSRIKIIDIIKSLNWNGGFYRKDIGYKVINE